MSAFHILIHRLIEFILSTDDNKKELSLIKTIAKNNGYNEYIIEFPLMYKKSYKDSGIYSDYTTHSQFHETKKPF